MVKQLSIGSKRFAGKAGHSVFPLSKSPARRVNSERRNCCSASNRWRVTRFALVLSLTALFAPLASAAEKTSVPRLCVLAADSRSSPWGTRYAEFIHGLSDLGYVDGKNITIDFLSADGKNERFPALAAECVGLNPEIIVAYTTPGSLAAKKATNTIPIVTGPIGDPVATGIVASLARPGGNITGQSLMAPELSSKRLQLLKEAVPALSLVAVLSTTDPIGPVQVQEIKEAANLLGLNLQIQLISTIDDLSTAFDAAVQGGAQAVLTTIETFFIIRRVPIAELAATHRLPAMYPVRDFADSGGLMSYGPNALSLYRYTSVQVDKILKGAKPADIPVEQPIKVEFIINLKTARALGLKLPYTLLGLADEVIE
jgi:putative ABC transport system substrate-binding protein